MLGVLCVSSVGPRGAAGLSYPSRGRDQCMGVVPGQVMSGLGVCGLDLFVLCHTPPQSPKCSAS